MDRIEALNRTAFLYFNAGVSTPAWQVHLATVIADDLILLIPLLLGGIWLWGNHAHRSRAVKACLVALLGVALNQAIGALWPHPRPFVIGLGHAWMTHAADASFPSDHITVFTGVGLTLLFDGAIEWGLLTLMVGLGVAWSRVFLGVHFPLDMAGAVVVASATYGVVSPFWRRLGTPCVSFAERGYRRLLARQIAAGWVHP